MVNGYSNLTQRIRDKCVVCSSQNLEKIYTLLSFPVYMGISKNQEPEKDVKENMGWQICFDCGNIQIENLLHPEYPYMFPHNPAIGKVWTEHHNAFAKFVSRNIEGVKDKRILDIGGGNLKLQKALSQHVTYERFSVIDTHQYEPIEHDKTDFIDGVFENETERFSKKYNIVVTSHTMEHFYEPKETLQKIWSILDYDDILCVSIPDIHFLLKGFYLNALNFEHTYLTNENTMRFLFEQCKFSLQEMQRFGEHSIFFCVKKDKVGKKPDLMSSMLPIITDGQFLSFENTSYDFYYSNQYLITKYFSHLEEDVKKINDEMEKYKGLKYIFGCHIFTQFLSSLGLNMSAVNGILDNDPAKIGNRLYGTPFVTQSPSVLQGKESPLIIVRAGHYTDEIKEGILNNHNKNAVII